MSRTFKPIFHLYPYRPGEIDRFVLRADFAEEREAVAWDWNGDAPQGRTWTLWRFERDASRILGIGGLADAGDGRWWAWALLSDLSPREWAHAVRFARQAIEGVERFNGAKQILASARDKNPAAVKVLRRLGFTTTRIGRDPRNPEVAYVYMMRAA